jgi:predicted PurR-regulated permease PerM
MKKEETIDREAFSKYLSWTIIILLLVLSYFLIKPFLIALVSGFILAYLIRPVFKKFSRKIGKNLSAIVCLILVLLIVIIPSVMVIGGVSKQAKAFLAENDFSSFLSRVSENEIFSSFDIDLESLFNEHILSLLTKWFASIISHLPMIIINILITLFAIYYILIKWEELAARLKEYIPFRDKEKVSKEISEITTALVYGTLFIALIELAVSALGFYLLGVNSFLLWAFLIFIFAFIPGIGPGFVWVPMAVFYFAVGKYFAFGGVVLIGLIVGIGIDGIIRGKVLGDKTRLNPLFMIIGIIGGVSLFGVFGFIIGPLVLIYALKLIEEELKSH